MNVKIKNKISSIAVYICVCMALLAAAACWHLREVMAAVAECGDRFLLSWYLQLAVFLTAAVLLAAFMLVKKRTAYHISIAVLITLLGLANMFVFKGLSAPDEVSHYISAYRLSSILLHQPAADEHGRVYIRACDLFLEDTDGRTEEVLKAAEEGREDVDRNLKIFGQALDEEVYRVYADPNLIPDESKTESKLSCQWTVNTTPIAYLPQALGISLSRLAGLGPLGLLRAGRLFNLIFFALMTALAVYIIPKAKELVCAAALLPMTLHLAGSMSYDVFVTACAFLFTALVFYMTEHGIGLKTGIAAALIIAALAPCKIVYSLLLVIVLIPAAKSFRKDKGSVICFVLLCAVLVCISMYVVNSATLSDYAEADERVIEWAGQAEGYTLSYLLHNPVKAIDIFYRSFLMMGGNWFSTMFGIYLGNQDPVFNVPYPVIGILAAGLLVIAAASEMRQDMFGRIVSAGTFTAVLGALMGSMLIAYTPLGSPYIQGVQGRYLLPVLPLLLSCIPGEWISVRKDTDRYILWTFVIIEAYVLLRVFATAAMRLA